MNNIKKYEADIIRDISRLVNSKSVYENDEKFLFGKGIDEALNVALDIMEGLGFRIYKADDGAYGYAEIGEGELFGVLGHLDVVNAREADGWETPPFTAVIKDGYIIGRGVQDDKGPIIAAAYALKSVLDEGRILNKRIRFIFGLDEETLWRSIAQYTKREEAPAIGFTPDSTFPLTYAEKGLLQVIVKTDEVAKLDYFGGDSFNAVPSNASCKATDEIKKALAELEYEYIQKGDELQVVGKTAHAKNPWKGINAIFRLSRAVKKAGYTNNATEFINDVLIDKFKFEGFSKDELSDFSGNVTVNLGKIQADKNGTVLSLDFRLPVSQKKEEIFDIISKTAAKYNLTAVEYDWLRPIYVPLESELVKGLLEAYTQVTNDTSSKPYISAGATYARAFDNCVAFGANMPNSATSEHQPNEKALISDILKASTIYRAAFEKLCFK